jgi:hypothetical protein
MVHGLYLGYSECKIRLSFGDVSLANIGYSRLGIDTFMSPADPHTVSNS